MDANGHDYDCNELDIQADCHLYVAAIIGGVLILAFERWDRKREPSEADVRQAAERYRQWYGNEAMAKIGDHTLAASFAPDGRHKRFLKRVSAVLQHLNN